MRKNVHNFPVLQQDIPLSHKPQPLHQNPNKRGPKPKNPNEIPVQKPENTENFGTFFDEVPNQEENKEALVIEQKKEKKKLFSFKPDLLLDPAKGLKALFMNFDKYKLNLKENSQNFDEVF